VDPPTADGSPDQRSTWNERRIDLEEGGPLGVHFLLDILTSGPHYTYISLSKFIPITISYFRTNPLCREKREVLTAQCIHTCHLIDLRLKAPSISIPSKGGLSSRSTNFSCGLRAIHFHNS